MFIDDSAVVERSPGVLGADVADAHVLLSADLEYVGIDAAGRRIWELVEDPITLAQLVERLLSEYDVDEQTCRCEVSDFLAALLANNLVCIS